ncbi:MAG: hypothetical protein ACRDRO_23430 [Pseudonocardiaceae bacterium]
MGADSRTVRVEGIRRSSAAGPHDPRPSRQRTRRDINRREIHMSQE